MAWGRASVVEIVMRNPQSPSDAVGNAGGVVEAGVGTGVGAGVGAGVKY